MTPIVCVKGDDEVMKDSGPSQVKVQIAGSALVWILVVKMNERPPSNCIIIIINAVCW